MEICFWPVTDAPKIHAVDLGAVVFFFLLRRQRVRPCRDGIFQGRCLLLLQFHGRLHLASSLECARSFLVGSVPEKPDGPKATSQPPADGGGDGEARL